MVLSNRETATFTRPYEKTDHFHLFLIVPLVYAVGNNIHSYVLTAVHFTVFLVFGCITNNSEICVTQIDRQTDIYRERQLDREMCRQMKT
jgi:hypothetical protein